MTDPAHRDATDAAGPADIAPPQRRRRRDGVHHRRKLPVILVVVLAALLTLAACGSAGGGSAADASADAGATDTQRTITDATGTEVQVPADPQRVVTLSELDLDSSLALGVTPVGTTAGRGQDGAPGYLDDVDSEQVPDGVDVSGVEGIPLVGTVTGPQLGKVIQADPDLILAGQVKDAQVLDKLREIAPTVVTFQVGDDWKDAFANVADALNRTSEYDAFMADYQEAVAETRNALGPEADAEVSVVRWTPKGPATINQGVFVSSVIADVGLTRPEGQMVHQVHSAPLSMENLDQIDADWIFLGTLSDEGTAAEKLDQAQQNPAFAALSAVQDGHVVTVDGSQWMSMGGPLAAYGVLGDLQQSLGTQQ